MAKKYQTFITACLVLVMFISGVQCDAAFYTLPLSGDIPTFVAAETGISESNVGYSRIEKQEYWSTGSPACISSSFFKRAQNGVKNYEKNERTFAVLNGSFKVILFSITMILFATGGTGLSMPFRCLLYFIHNKDGKKEYC